MVSDEYERGSMSVAEYKAGTEQRRGSSQAGTLGLHVRKKLVIDLPMHLALHLVCRRIGTVENTHQFHCHGKLASHKFLIPEGLLKLSHAAAAVGGKTHVEGK